MRPVKQSKIHSVQVRGNCLAAAVASILEIGIDDVPAFEQMQPNVWKSQLIDFLWSYGYQVVESKKSFKPGLHYIAIGKSARGYNHCAVYKDGKMIHDPHPDDSGLLAVDRVFNLIKQDVAASDQP